MAKKSSNTKTKNVKKINEKAIDNKCPGCGAPIHFNPSLNKWKCEYCSSEFSLEEMQKHNNASSIQNNDNVEENIEQVNEDVKYISYKCKNCGAEIIADEQTAATFCVYCGNTAILKSKLSGKFAPDYIIPFKTEKKLAEKAFQDLSKGRPFMPKDFNNIKNIEKIRGIYIPFWLYSLNVGGSLNFNGQRVKSWTAGDRHYTRIDYYKLYRTGSMKFERIPIDGATRFDNAIMNSIEPFDYEKLEKYNHAYLSGFYAEKYDVENDVAIGFAVNRAIESAKKAMLDDAPTYSGKTIFQNTLRSETEKKEYVLLPVWMVNVKYKDKTYIFAMNGQTGEFIGDIPIDKTKVVISSIGLFVLLFFVILLISYIIYIIGV